MRIETLRVLVVDDNEIARLVTRVLLNDGGCLSVTEAQGGAEAIHCLNTGSFDLVLCDVYMPDMSGLEVLRHIKNTEELGHLRVLMVSAADAEDVSCEQADGYLVKPFEGSTLKEKIKELFG